jgi:hypothetical protein
MMMSLNAMVVELVVVQVVLHRRRPIFYRLRCLIKVSATMGGAVTSRSSLRMKIVIPF